MIFKSKHPIQKLRCHRILPFQRTIMRNTLVHFRTKKKVLFTGFVGPFQDIIRSVYFVMRGIQLYAVIMLYIMF